MVQEYRFVAHRIAKDAILELLLPEKMDLEKIPSKVEEVLFAYGLSEETAPLVDPSRALCGAIEGWGGALIFEKCQNALFPFVTRISEIAGPHLRSWMHISIFHWYASENRTFDNVVADIDFDYDEHDRIIISEEEEILDDLSDRGYLLYMNWFLELRNNPLAKWAVEDAYSYYEPTRLLRHIKWVSDRMRELTDHPT